MKPSSGHFNNTSGNKAYTSQQKIDIINSVNKGKTNKIPNSIAQIDHIFADREGHLSFTEENVNTISDLINNDKNKVLDSDKNNNSWFTSTNSDGSQLWGKVHDNVLSDGGLNKTPKELDEDTGFDKNPFKKEGK